MSRTVKSMANIQNVVITQSDAILVTATFVGIKSCTTQGWRPTSATIQPHWEAM